MQTLILLIESHLLPILQFLTLFKEGKGEKGFLTILEKNYNIGRMWLPLFQGCNGVADFSLGVLLNLVIYITASE